MSQSFLAAANAAHHQGPESIFAAGNTGSRVHSEHHFPLHSEHHFPLLMGRHELPDPSELLQMTAPGKIGI